MSKKLKIILGIVLGVILIIGLFFLSSLSENKNFKRISYDDYISYTSSSSNENYVVFFGDKESENAKNLKKFIEEKDLSIKYVDTNSLTDEQKEKVFNDTNQKEKLVFISKGTEETYTSDYSTFSLTNEFINKNIIQNTLVEIDIENYLKLIKSNGKHIIFIGRETCSWCQKYKPIMKSVAEEYNITLYYIDTDKFVNDDWNRFTSSEKYLQEEKWGTPLTFLYSDGKLVDIIGGYVEANDVYDFLQKYGVIK